MNGWVKLHRSLLEWEWYDDINTKIVFIHLLLKASTKAKKYKGVEVPRGGIVVGRKALAQQVGLSEQQVRTTINKLKSTGEITTKATNDFTVITICNWATYQGKDRNNQPADQPTDNQQITTSKEGKNIRRGESTHAPARASDNSYKLSVNGQDYYVDKNVVNQFRNSGLNSWEKELENFWMHYEAQGWVTGNGRPITNKIAQAAQWIRKAKFDPNYNQDQVNGTQNKPAAISDPNYIDPNYN